jgi:solute carrier family 25 2-oxodicarboxylate transporter 21
MVEAPKRAIKFSANESVEFFTLDFFSKFPISLLQYKTLYKSYGFQEGQLMSIATGVSAGITEATIVSTPDLVKIRLQDKANVKAIIFLQIDWMGH